jgi:F-type H+-transporting ATPase subunit delta
VIAPHIARRYAKALLELGAENNSLDALVSDLDKIGRSYEESAELRRSLANPQVALQSKKAIVSELADKLGASPLARTALMLLADRRRLSLLPEIAQFLKEMTDLRAGLIRAVVTTAVPMSDAYYEKLRQTLERLTGRKVVLDKKTDPTIIAGVITRIGDRVLDGSIRARLASLKSSPLALN